MLRVSCKASLSDELGVKRLGHLGAGCSLKSSPWELGLRHTGVLPLSDVFRRSSLFWGAGPRDGKFLLLKVDLGLEIVKGKLVLKSGEGTLFFFFLLE